MTEHTVCECKAICVCVGLLLFENKGLELVTDLLGALEANGGFAAPIPYKHM